MLHSVINRGVFPCGCDLEGDIELYFPEYDLTLRCYYQESRAELIAELPIGETRLADISVIDATIKPSDNTQASLTPQINGDYVCQYTDDDGSQLHMVDAGILLDVDCQPDQHTDKPHAGDWVEVNGLLYVSVAPKANHDQALYAQLNRDTAAMDLISKQAIDLLQSSEVAIRFETPHANVLAEIRAMVLWLKERKPSSKIVAGNDGKSLAEICQHLFSSTQVPIEKIVHYTIEEIEFGEDGFQLSYASRINVEEQQELGLHVPQDVVIISYWVGGFSDVAIPLALYLRELADYLRTHGHQELLKQLKSQTLIARPYNTRIEEFVELNKLIPQIFSALPYSHSVHKKQLHSQLAVLQKQIEPYLQQPHNKLGQVRWYQLWK
ncbi:hypothetical protein NM22_08265 [Vibrio tubiashii]|nr:hypothetical protein NM22_08265 [Vibrio tubiashii]